MGNCNVDLKVVDLLREFKEFKQQKQLEALKALSESFKVYFSACLSLLNPGFLYHLVCLTCNVSLSLL